MPLPAQSDPIGVTSLRGIDVVFFGVTPDALPSRPDLPDHLAPVYASFEANLASTVSVLVLPLQSAVAHLAMPRLDVLAPAHDVSYAEKALRACAWLLEEVRQGHEYRRALSNVRLRLREVDDPVATAGEAFDLLTDWFDSFARYEILRTSHHELLKQGLVLTWTALEVFSFDLFRSHLNAHPQSVQKLLADREARRALDIRDVRLESLSEYGFNLADAMGDFIIDQYGGHFRHNLFGIKALYGALFGADEDVRSALDEPDLRLLQFRRNLIVHQSGRADRTYLQQSGEMLEPGAEIQVRPVEVLRSLITVARAARALAVAASSDPG
jgi:hypothetical protein